MADSNVSNVENDDDGVLCSWLLLTGFSAFLQENNKTKHPQLLYEAKLYRSLQGGSTLACT